MCCYFVGVNHVIAMCESGRALGGADVFHTLGGEPTLC